MRIGNALVAIGISLSVHALIGAALWTYLEYAPKPDALAELDLSSVELSFAEKVEESAAVMPMPMVAPAVEQKTEPEKAKPPEFEEKIDKTLPPDPTAMKLPEPKEEVKIKEEVRRKKEEVKRVEDREKRAENREKRVENREKRAATPQPVAAPRQAKIDAMPRPKRSIRPDYPREARRRGEQGDVQLEIAISDEGKVTSAKVAKSSGFTDLDDAAIKAVYDARFTPAKSQGRSVASTAKITLKFKLK